MQQSSPHSNATLPAVTTRRTAAANRGSQSNSNSNSNSTSTSSSSSTPAMHNTSRSTSSSKWKLVRPWAPPSTTTTTNTTNTTGNSSSLEDGQDDHDTMTQDEEDEGEDSHVIAAGPSSSSYSSSSRNRLYLEVRDVSSTSVSLSVFGQPAGGGDATTPSGMNSNTQSHQQYHQIADGGVGSSIASSSTSNATNPTVPLQTSGNLAVSQRSRSRAASTSSDRYAHQHHHHQHSHTASSPQQPPNISIKLNSAAWPHVFHTDSSFFDAESGRSSQEDNAPSASSILVWGLSPGQNYHIELGVFEDPVDDDDDGMDADDLSDTSETEDGVRVAASVRTLDATEPDVPPPPYSSHDPSSANSTHNDAEVVLRSILDQLRLTTKQKEASLQSSIASMRRANDKLTREDQRHRQRIHMLEDSTSRLREVAADEDAEHEAVREQIDELEETEKTLIARLERRRNQIEKAEKQAKEEGDKDDSELAELKERLDKIAEREEEVLAKKLKLEREQLPTYNIQLATLEADLRRLVDDHRRRFPYQHHLPPHAFSTQLAHNQNLPHVHTMQPAAHAAGRGNGPRPHARGGGHAGQQPSTSVGPAGGVGPSSSSQAGQYSPFADDRSGLSSPIVAEDLAEPTAQEKAESTSSAARSRHVSSPGLLNVTAKDRDLGNFMSSGPAVRNRSGSLRAGTVPQDSSSSSSGRQQQASPTSALFGGSGIFPGEGSERNNSPIEQEDVSATPAPPSTSTGTVSTGSEIRTSSRFGWSKPNTWASKVASGVRSSSASNSGVGNDNAASATSS